MRDINLLVSGIIMIIVVLANPKKAPTENIIPPDPQICNYAELCNFFSKFFYVIIIELI